MADRRMVFAALLAAACSRSLDPDPGSDVKPPQVAIVAPSPGAVVVDTVQVEISARDDDEVARVALLADDGSVVGERFRAPWVFAWTTEGLPDSSVHRLQAFAVDAHGNTACSAECPVLVRANGPPEVAILEPRPEAWIDLDRADCRWQARAADPDDGPLSGEAIVWWIDGARMEATGSDIARPQISAGTHTVAVEASDRWGTRARASCTVTGFRYPGSAGPGDALLSFLFAIRAGDAASALALLATGFRFHVPAEAADDPAGIEAQLALQALFASERFVSLTLGMDCGPIERSVCPAGETAQAELRGLTLAARLTCPRNDFVEPAQVEWEIGPTVARLIFLLNGADGSSGWRLAGWWDLHGAVWGSTRGSSFTDLLRAAESGRLCHSPRGGRRSRAPSPRRPSGEPRPQGPRPTR